MELKAGDTVKIITGIRKNEIHRIRMIVGERERPILVMEDGSNWWTDCVEKTTI